MKLLKFLCLAIPIILAGCSDKFDLDLAPENETEASVKKSHSVSETEAAVIAFKVIQKIKGEKTRSFGELTPSITCVRKSDRFRTRSNDLPDTVAYIVNYPNNGGFVIVAGDRRVKPVLAYSAESNFYGRNEIAKKYFLDNIETYIAESDSNGSYDSDDNYLDGCYIIPSATTGTVHQEYPWNKYVLIDHPNCVAGCAPVATGLLLCYTKVYLRYHDTDFYLQSIAEALARENKKKCGRLDVSRAGDTDLHPYYTYEEATDMMAKLLYFIGIDEKTKYNPPTSTSLAISTTFTLDVFALCQSLNLPMSSSQLEPFNLFDVAKLVGSLEDPWHIIYVSGTNATSPGDPGHSWVITGATYCVDPENRDQVTQAWVYCDWGWGDGENGYYDEEIFHTQWADFKPTQYIAVEREWR